MLAEINELRKEVMLLADGKLTLKERAKLKSKAVGLTIMAASAKLQTRKNSMIYKSKKVNLIPA